MSAKWERLEFSEEYYYGFDLKDEPGVYVVFNDYGVLYIGQSSSLKKRFASHKVSLNLVEKIDGSIDSFKNTPWGCHETIYLKVSYSRKLGDWAMREIRLIKKVNPVCNSQHSKKERLFLP